MNESSHFKNSLVIQIREAYGRIVYTYTTHLKLMNRLARKNNAIKIWQIILSAISTGGFIGSMITSEFILTCVGGVFSTVLLAMNLFFKDFNLLDEAKQHRTAADELWLIREKYISLLTDACVLNVEDIVLRRDELQNETYNLYKQSPKTDAKSYTAAQKALKKDEEQFFTEEEVDKLLPPHLRTTNKS
ncbi:SLATT domain-containing protein [Desulfosarcina sp. OttesenSCG-928-G10]|nr:SLATT domain-containing protein [Desulfosarcina sp. OttesenSCG-928-G10]